MYSMILLKEDHVNVAVQQLFARLGTLVIRGTWYTAYVCNKVGSNCKKVYCMFVIIKCNNGSVDFHNPKAKE